MVYAPRILDGPYNPTWPRRGHSFRKQFGEAVAAPIGHCHCHHSVIALLQKMKEKLLINDIFVNNIRVTYFLTRSSVDLPSSVGRKGFESVLVRGPTGLTLMASRPSSFSPLIIVFITDMSDSTF